MGIPVPPEHEAYGGAGTLGATGAVDREVSRRGTVGVSRTSASARVWAAERQYTTAPTHRKQEQEAEDEVKE